MPAPRLWNISPGGLGLTPRRLLEIAGRRHPRLQRNAPRPHGGRDAPDWWQGRYQRTEQGGTARARARDGAHAHWTQQQLRRPRVTVYTTLCIQWYVLVCSCMCARVKCVVWRRLPHHTSPSRSANGPRWSRRFPRTEPGLPSCSLTARPT